MTDTSTPAIQITRGPSGTSYVEWSAIFAGAMLASAIIVLMTAFGSAIGLSLVSPYHGPSPAMFYVALALWVSWITVSSFVAGGYVTGRLRRPIDGATPHEVHVRDGAHGLVVWAVAVVIGASLATFSLSSAVTTMSLSSAIKGGVDHGKSASSAIASSLSPRVDPMGYEADALLRNDGAPMGANADSSRQEVARILTKGAADGAVSADDRAYLARIVSARAGLKPTDAEKRVDAISAQIKTSADKERAATETARKAGIILAFLTAASMVLGAAAAWWGAGVGGRHRDENFDASHLTRW
jgi:hypothetical protein